MCYTNISPQAPWWATLYSSDPWETAPSYSALVGFHISMVEPDLLHVWNLGVGQYAAGSALRVILGDRVVFGGSNLDDRLEEATTSLIRYVKAKGKHLRFKKLTKARLCWKSKQYPQLAAHGYDTFLVLDWLEEILADHAGTYSQIYTLLWAGNRSMKLLYDANQFLTIREKESLRQLGQLFLQTYVGLAQDAINNGKLLWRCIPKLHLLSHLYHTPKLANPAFLATWMDEDFLRKATKTLELTASRTAGLRFLERWLMGLPSRIQTVMAEP